MQGTFEMRKLQKKKHFFVWIMECFIFIIANIIMIIRSIII